MKESLLNMSGASKIIEPEGSKKETVIFRRGLEGGAFDLVDGDQEVAYSTSYAPGAGTIIQGVLEPDESHEAFTRRSKIVIANPNQFGTGGVILEYMKKKDFMAKFVPSKE